VPVTVCLVLSGADIVNVGHRLLAEFRNWLILVRRTTKAFERSLEGLAMAAPRTLRTWALALHGSDRMREKAQLIRFIPVLLY
jgi:hypothetical protein